MNEINILDLAPELLLAIFEQTSPRDLFVLSLLCRRLHYLCLTLYLAQHGIDDATHESTIEVCIALHDIAQPYPPRSPPQLDALSGLRIALFVPHIKRLTWTLTHAKNPRLAPHWQRPYCGHGMDPIIQQVQRLNSLVQRLSALEHVSLVFEYCRCCYNGSQDGGNDLILEQWASALGNLLDSMVGKCTSLTIRGGEIMKDAYSVFILPSRARDFNQPSKVSFALRAAKRLLGIPASGYEGTDTPGIGGTGWRFRRKLGYRSRDGIGTFVAHRPEVVLFQPSSKALSNATLQELSLTSSSILLYPPFSKWTLTFFRISTLTVLRIDADNLNKLEYVDVSYNLWDAMLPEIASAAKSLTELYLRGRALSAATVVNCVCRLPPLTTISLDDTFREFEPHIFKSQSAHIPIPDLSHAVSLHAPPFLLYHFLAPTLRSGRPSRLSKLQTISIYAGHNVGRGPAIDYGMSDFIQSVEQNPQFIPRKISMKVSHSRPLLYDFPLARENMSDCGIIRTSRCIHTIIADFPQILPRDARQLAGFLSLFEGIRHLELGQEVLCGEADIAEAIDVIHTSNPQLQTITYHGDTWLGRAISPMSN